MASERQGGTGMSAAHRVRTRRAPTSFLSSSILGGTFLILLAYRFSSSHSSEMSSGHVVKPESLLSYSAITVQGDECSEQQAGSGWCRWV